MGERDEAKEERPRRWQRREKRRRSERARVQKHGVSVKRVYAAAILKRLWARKKS